jgi:lipoprotein-anchoring transpeptidase ErfK/SrfK
MACLAAKSSFARNMMTRVFALLVAAAALLAGTAGASAQGMDMRDIMGGGPNFRGGGSSPIPRTTVSYASTYSPGTVVVNTAERRLYLVLPNGQMLRRRPDLPRHMAGGVDNPLGARAMYLGSTLYRIHGSNEPETIGQAVSSGCFRMTNDDVTDLYSRVSVGTTVVVKN